MTRWFASPGPPLTTTEAPHLVADDAVESLRGALKDGHVRVVELQLVEEGDDRPFLEQLVTGLPFPAWTGRNWNAVFDVIEELSEGLTGPHAVIVHGYGRLLCTHQHRAMYLLIRMHEVQQQLARLQRQLLVYYSGSSWS
jgi:hypothetical protein